MKLYEVSVDIHESTFERQVRIEEHDIIKETEKTWVVQNGKGVRRYHKDNEDVVIRGNLRSSYFKFYSLDEDVAYKVIEKGLKEGINMMRKRINFEKNQQLKSHKLLDMLNEQEETK